MIVRRHFSYEVDRNKADHCWFPDGNSREALVPFLTAEHSLLSYVEVVAGESSKRTLKALCVKPAARPATRRCRTTVSSTLALNQSVTRIVAPALRVPPDLGSDPGCDGGRQDSGRGKNRRRGQIYGSYPHSGRMLQARRGSTESSQVHRQDECGTLARRLEKTSVFTEKAQRAAQPRWSRQSRPGTR